MENKTLNPVAQALKNSLDVIGDIELNCSSKERKKINEAFRYLESNIILFTNGKPVIVAKSSDGYIGKCPACRGEVKIFTWIGHKTKNDLYVDPRPYCPECGQRLTGGIVKEVEQLKH